MTFPTYASNVLVEGHEHVYYFEAAEGVTQGHVVKLDGNTASRSVEPSDTDGEKVFGVALHDQSSGAQVAVAGPGAVVRAVSATGSISSGAWLASDGGTSDEGELETAASGDHVFGIALEDDTGTGTEGSIVALVHPAIYGNP